MRARKRPAFMLVPREFQATSSLPSSIFGLEARAFGALAHVWLRSVAANTISEGLSPALRPPWNHLHNPQHLMLPRTHGDTSIPVAFNRVAIVDPRACLPPRASSRLTKRAGLQIENSESAAELTTREFKTCFSASSLKTSLLFGPRCRPLPWPAQYWKKSCSLSLPDGSKFKPPTFQGTASR